MAIRVTEIESPESGRPELANTESTTEGAGILLKVEGTLHSSDAELLEEICRDLAAQTRKRITLDLANLSFLDSDSASILCRLKRELDVRLEGLHLFIGKVVELAEESERVERYRPRTVTEVVKPSLGVVKPRERRALRGSKT